MITVDKRRFRQHITAMHNFMTIFNLSSLTLHLRNFRDREMNRNHDLFVLLFHVVSNELDSYDGLHNVRRQNAVSACPARSTTQNI